MPKPALFWVAREMQLPGTRSGPAWFFTERLALASLIPSEGGKITARA